MVDHCAVRASMRLSPSCCFGETTAGSGCRHRSPQKNTIMGSLEDRESPQCAVLPLARSLIGPLSILFSGSEKLARFSIVEPPPPSVVGGRLGPCLSACPCLTLGKRSKHDAGWVNNHERLKHPSHALLSPAAPPRPTLPCPPPPNAFSSCAISAPRMPTTPSSAHTTPSWPTATA